jgi:hypothetical protein
LAAISPEAATRLYPIYRFEIFPPTDTIPASDLQKGNRAMKTLTKFMLLAGLAMGGMFLTGCTATPAYSGDERAAQIQHNISQEWTYIADDTDYILMLRPESTMTVWNVFHR